jgi:hypothetical protein
MDLLLLKLRFQVSTSTIDKRIENNSMPVPAQPVIFAGGSETIKVLAAALLVKGLTGRV